jgi:hypothetical protein
MIPLRTIFLVVCSLLVLATGGSASGFSWCVQGDGSIRLEAAGPDGRCRDAEGLAATDPEAPAGFHSVSRPMPCVDLAGTQVRLASNPKSEIGRAALLTPVVIQMVIPVISSVLTVSAPRRPAPTRDKAIFADITFIRDTVSLVI